MVLAGAAATRAVEVPPPAGSGESRVAAPPDAALPAPALEAALDLVYAYRLQLLGPPALGELRQRFDAALVDLDSTSNAPVRAAADAGSMAAADAEARAARLLRLRVLESIASRIHRHEAGLFLAAAADSMARGLTDGSDAAPSWLLAAAGVPRARREDAELAALLETWWQRFWSGEEPGSASAFLHYHALAACGVVAPMPAAAAPRDRWSEVLAELARAAALGRVRLFVADDPARRLHLARAAASGEERADDWSFDAPGTYARCMARLDSLDAAFRAAPSPARLGSSRNYYRRDAETSRAAAPSRTETARSVVESALPALRAHLGAILCDRLGIRAAAELEPVEIVSGQAVRARWSLESREAHPLDGLRAGIAALEVRILEAPDSTGALAHVRTAAVASPEAASGTVLAPELRLAFRLPPWGPVEIHDRAELHVVTPVQANLVTEDGPLFETTHKSLEVVVTSRSPQPLGAMVRILPTAGWEIAPARLFRLELRRPGQSVQQRIEVTLPASASPGAYDFAARLEIGDETVGTLRTRLVKPVRWIAAGPFAVPRGSGTLPPERGIDLQAQHPGAAARPMWQVVPWRAYTEEGDVDLGRLEPLAPENACAVLFTMFESSEAGRAVLRQKGATRVRWNGKEPGPGGAIDVERGRNTLVVRAPLAASASLHVACIDEAGEAWRVLDNDLARLLDGFDRLGAETATSSAAPPGERLVTLRFRSGTAKEVAVLGAFNAWVPLRLERQADGTWQRALRLTPGRYAYKLLVDGAMRPDPEARLTEPDGFGGRNSLLVVP